MAGKKNKQVATVINKGKLPSTAKGRRVVYKANEQDTKTAQPRRRIPTAFYSRGMSFNGMPLLFNGEKNLGELGPVTELFMDYQALGARGHYAYITNEVVQIIINRMMDWVIGNGLKLEAEPSDAVLKMHGITLDSGKFSDDIEAMFSLIKESNESSYSRMNNLSEMERSAYMNSSNGGGILVVIRIRNGIINYELIDGSHVKSPYGGTDTAPVILSNGNRIMNGIEMKDNGEHVRFWVQNSDLVFVPIEAKNRTTGLTTAFMYGGKEGRIDDSRTRPILAGLFETLAQMDGYKTATLGSAKEQNKVAYQVVYDVKADGDSLLSPDNILRAFDADGHDGTIPVDAQLQAVADRVTASTMNKTFAMPVGSEAKALGKNEAELYFDAFWNVLCTVSCAAAGIPKSVAIMKYEGSFSSARAELKDWAHSMLIFRYQHRRFLKPGYEMQLHLDIVTGKIKAPGYLQAYRDNNIFVLEAYRKARWVGDAIFEIDELKEIQAVRAKLGPLFDNYPLIDPPQGNETLNGGDLAKAVANASKLLKESVELGFPIPTTNKEQPKQVNEPPV